LTTTTTTNNNNNNTNTTTTLEFILASWSRSNVYGLKYETKKLPLIGQMKVPVLLYDGYLFSFFWILDLASIFSLFFDIDWIADPIGIGEVKNDVSGNTKYAQASQVVRLVRLTRLVHLYRIYTMKKRKQVLKKKIIENAANEGLDVETVETELKKLDLYAQRDSKLGVLLNDSTTKKLILLILAILFILPLLTTTIANDGPMLIVNTLQYANKASSYTIAQKQEIVDITLKQFGSFPKSQYFDSSDTSYLIYLEMTPSFSDLLVYDTNKFRINRDNSITTYSVSETISGVTYQVVAKFDNERLFRDRYYP